ncbi:hypothetical protein CKR_1970 [Clostridium kluyveri NBRC 12016]|uniref:Uncharacterized protein n=3 Tax=Clostridium kluyveri TaxID=1534 RepID=A5MZF4_CLOK5|nr:Hypothetical protein CKL_2238 [Clostridium kluyveri DSM 555]BAH07021.1 hypothetical protein CKR_1970 [Clostridium kluyveri NBRC 12016]
MQIKIKWGGENCYNFIVEMLMKIKKIIIIGISVIICISVLAIIWNTKSKSLKSSDIVNTTTNSNTSNKSKGTVSKNGENSNQVETKSSDKAEDKIQPESSANSSTSASISKSAAILKAELESQSKSESENASNPQLQTFTGYITTEDDFAAGLKEDTAAMIYMRLMALSGLGITFQENGEWVFYYFDGNIATDNKDGEGDKWVFDGTGSQLNAWNIVKHQVELNNGSDKMKPVPVTVTGVLDGSMQNNPGPDADGKRFPVITVQSITKN